MINNPKRTFTLPFLPAILPASLPIGTVALPVRRVVVAQHAGELGVRVREQRPRSRELGHLSSAHDEDLVAVQDGVEAMRDGQHRGAVFATLRLQRLLDGLVCRGVAR